MSDKTTSLKSELVDLVVSRGAVGARVADLEMLEGPPSTDLNKWSWKRDG